MSKNNNVEKVMDSEIEMSYVKIIVKDKDGNIIEDDIDDWCNKTRPNYIFRW